MKYKLRIAVFPEAVRKFLPRAVSSSPKSTASDDEERQRFVEGNTRYNTETAETVATTSIEL